MTSLDDLAEAQAAPAAAAKAAKPTQAEVLVGMAVAAGELWHDARGDAWISLAVGGHREHYPVRSTACRRWLIATYYRETGRGPSAQALSDAVTTLAAAGAVDGAEHAVFVRVAHVDGAMYLDLGDPAWRAVAVTPDGWSVVAAPPVRFRRDSGSRPLPEPVEGGSIGELWELLTIDDASARSIVLAWLLATLGPRGPYPILALTGEQGSAKSTSARILRALVDPADPELRPPPREERDLMIAAAGRWVLAYDNLSGVPPWLSDALCRLATGAGFSARSLYTDAEEIAWSACRPLLANGIDALGDRQDLADRAWLVSLPPIPRGSRRTEAELWQALEASRPRILGALLDAVALGLGQLPTVQLPHLPRMADAVRWVTACESPETIPAGQTLAATSANQQGVTEAHLAADPLAVAVRHLVDRRGPIEGEPTQVLAWLAEEAPEHLVKQLPASPRHLSRALKRIAPGLRVVGIAIDLDGRAHGGRRVYRLNPSEPESEGTPSPPSPPPPIPAEPGGSIGGPLIALSGGGVSGGDGDDEAPPVAMRSTRAKARRNGSGGAGGDGGDGQQSLSAAFGFAPATPDEEAGAF